MGCILFLTILSENKGKENQKKLKKNCALSLKEIMTFPFDSDEAIDVFLWEQSYWLFAFWERESCFLLILSFVGFCFVKFIKRRETTILKKNLSKNINMVYFWKMSIVAALQVVAGLHPFIWKIGIYNSWIHDQKSYYCFFYLKS